MSKVVNNILRQEASDFREFAGGDRDPIEGVVEEIHQMLASIRGDNYTQSVESSSDGVVEL